MTRTCLLAVPLLALPFGCGDDGGGQADAEPEAEILDPEPPGAPTAVADGDLACLGDNTPDMPDANSVELTGYVRAFSDPRNEADPTLIPAAEVEAFSAGGTSLGTSFVEPDKDGRVSVVVGIGDEGFSGYVTIADAAFLSYRFQTNRAVTKAEANGWAWLLTQTDVDDMATTLGVTQDAGNGILAGSVHDCRNFGTGEVVVVVDDQTDGVYYTTEFAPSATATFTDASGYFVVPNAPPGAVTVKAFGRLTADGPLTLLSSVDTEVVAGTVTSVGLQPR